MKTEMETVSVTEVKAEAPDIKSIFVKVDENSELANHRPGQYGMVALRDNGSWTTPRSFTFSNPPAGKTVRLTIKNVDAYTNKFHSLQPGDTIGIKGPFGEFCSRIETSKAAIMIAGGLGITPFLSVLRYYTKNPGLGRITLFWGNTNPDRFFSLHELDAFHFFLDFSAVIVSETPFQFKHLQPHRITTLSFAQGLLTADLMKKYADFNNCDVLVCGPGAMQLYIRNQLQLCGVDEGRIETEKFGS